MTPADEPTSTGGGLLEPVAPALRATLRRAVLDLTAPGRARQPAPVLHVGVPGGTERLFARLEEADDHTLRTDVVAALVSRTRSVGPPIVWLTRSGGLELQDVDAQWLAAARSAYAEAGLPLVMVVVNRHGWRDPRSGLGQTWVRLRPRS